MSAATKWMSTAWRSSPAATATTAWQQARGATRRRKQSILAAPTSQSLQQLSGSGRRHITTDAGPTSLQFDTHRVVKKLQNKGFAPEQAEAILEVIKDSMAESLDAQSRVLATKSEHVELKAELSERVFNSTLKFDIAQRHMRELLERDFNNLKQDIRMLEKMDFDKIRVEIAELEKKKQAEDATLNDLRLSMEKVEKRMLQYAVGFASTIMAVGAAITRLFM